MSDFYRENVRDRNLGVTVLETRPPSKWSSFSDPLEEKDLYQYQHMPIGEINHKMDKVQLDF